MSPRWMGDMKSRRSIDAVSTAYHARLPTAKVNGVIEAAVRAQEPPMVHEVPRRDPGERAYRDAAAAGHARAGPGVAGEAGEQGERGEPHGPRVLADPVPGQDAHRVHALVRLEARQFAAEATGEPERAEREDALGVAHVADHLAHRPLPRFVAVVGPMPDPLQERVPFLGLPRERAADVSVGHLHDVPLVVRVVFGRAGTGRAVAHAAVSHSDGAPGVRRSCMLHDDQAVEGGSS